MKRLRYPFALLVGLALSGCVSNDEVKLCPDGALKEEPGICGCDVEDVDSDGDTIMDCIRLCPEGAKKTAPGVCGCDVEDVDSDGDTIMDCVDLCPEDPKKNVPGVCGCGVEDVDSDGDTVMDCIDLCPNDPKKTQEGVCGCGIEDVDSDGDTVMDCIDRCQDDPNKIEPGICGCGVEDSAENIADSDGDGVPNCIDGCPDNPYKTAPGDSTCEDRDSDGDGVDDPLDDCPYNPEIQELAEGEDCNLRMHTLENGEKVEVFEVWSAHDLLTLRKITEKLVPRIAEGMPCMESGTIQCEDAGTSNRALFCDTAGEGFDIPRWWARECAETCQEVGNKTICESVVTCKDPTANLEAGECCDDTTFTRACSADLTSYKICEKSGGIAKVVVMNCDHGEICDAEKVSCVDSGETKLTIGGKAGDICDRRQYQSTCLDEHTFLTCESGLVVENACDSTCYKSGENETTCYVASKDAVELRVELMQDIVLSDAFQPMKAPFGIQGIHWTPIDLRHMVFDGKGHKIVASKDGSVVVNMPFFGIVDGSTVKNLTLEYNVMGAGYGVWMDMATQSSFEHLVFRGNYSLTRSLFGEAGYLNYSGSVLGQVLHQSFFNDIVLDSEQWDEGSLFAISLECIYENLDVNVTNVNFTTGSLYFEGMNSVIGGQSLYDVVRDSKFKFANLESMNRSEGDFIAMILLLFGGNVENVEIELDSALQKEALMQDSVDFAVVKKLMGGSRFGHISIKFGNIGNKMRNLMNPSHETTCSSFSLIEDPSVASFDTIEISADRIMAEYVVLMGNSAESSISGLDVDIKEIEALKTFYGFGTGIEFEGARIHYGTINAPVAYPLFQRFDERMKNVELNIDKIFAQEARFFSQYYDGEMDYFTAHIGEVYAGSYAYGWEQMYGSLTHSAVRIDKLVVFSEGLEPTVLFKFIGATGTISDSSFYLNRYVERDNGTGSFAFQIVPDIKAQAEPLKNVVVSGESYLYGSVKDFVLQDVKPIENPVWCSEMDVATPGTLYWLKRTSAASFSPAGDAFIPYYWDKTLDATPESALDTDAVVKLLGDDWSALTLSNENKNTIPWFTGKMPVAEESGTPAE